MKPSFFLAKYSYDRRVVVSHKNRVAEKYSGWPKGIDIYCLSDIDGERVIDMESFVNKKRIIEDK